MPQNLPRRLIHHRHRINPRLRHIYPSPANRHAHRHHAPQRPSMPVFERPPRKRRQPDLPFHLLPVRRHHRQRVLMRQCHIHPSAIHRHPRRRRSAYRISRNPLPQSQLRCNFQFTVLAHRVSPQRTPPHAILIPQRRPRLLRWIPERRKPQPRRQSIFLTRSFHRLIFEQPRVSHIQSAPIRSQCHLQRIHARRSARHHLPPCRVHHHHPPVPLVERKQSHPIPRKRHRRRETLRP